MATTDSKAIRKSGPPKRDWASGNEAKYLSYREAWARIKLAQKQGFYLEAVTIEESILSDRMLSYLIKTRSQSLKANVVKSFGLTLQTWSKLIADSDSSNEGEVDLCNLIDEWRQMRNETVHGMVKSTVGHKEDHIDDFLSAAKKAAAEGEALARKLDRWVSSSQTKAKKT